MSDDSPTPIRRPTPRPADTPENYVVDRRKILLGLGFGTAALAGLRGMDGVDDVVLSTGSLPATDDAPETTAATEANGAITTNEPEPFEAPVFDAQLRLAEGQTADVCLLYTSDAADD